MQSPSAVHTQSGGSLRSGDGVVRHGQPDVVVVSGGFCVAGAADGQDAVWGRRVHGEVVETDDPPVPGNEEEK